MGSPDATRSSRAHRLLRSRLPRLAGTAGFVLATLVTAAPAEAGPLAPPAPGSPAGPSSAAHPDVAARPDSPTGPGGAWAGYSVGVPARPGLPPAAGLTGVDVSGHQGAVDWPAAKAAGTNFAFVKASEGNGMRSDQFTAQYRGAKGAGLLHGAYHFGLPDRSSGADQANFFLANGGFWAPGRHALPGALDIERNPYGDICYGMNPQAMSAWIADFSSTYRARTGRFPFLYTTTSWWNRCTGSNPDFAAQNPLWVARYGPDTGALPAGWNTHTIWQFADQGPLPGDQNSFNGPPDQLDKLTT